MLREMLQSLIGYFAVKFKNQGIATIVVVGTVILIGFAVALASKHYLGDGNWLEKDAEDVIDMAGEEALHLPKGAINIDLDKK